MRSLFITTLCALAASSAESRTLPHEDNKPVVLGDLEDRGYTTYCFGEPGKSMALKVYNQNGQTDTALAAIAACNQTVNPSVCPTNPEETVLCWYEEEDTGGSLDIGALTTDSTDPTLETCVEPKAKGYCQNDSLARILAITLPIAALALTGASYAAYKYRERLACGLFSSPAADRTPLLSTEGVTTAQAPREVELASSSTATPANSV